MQTGNCNTVNETYVSNSRNDTQGLNAVVNSILPARCSGHFHSEDVFQAGHYLEQPKTRSSIVE